MNIDMENIDTFETRTKLNTIRWRPIYEVIDEDYFMGSKIFSDGLLKNVRIIQMKLVIYHAKNKIILSEWQ